MHDVDYASMTSWGRDMQDWRKGLELSQIWHNKYVLSAIPEAHVGEAPIDRGLLGMQPGFFSAQELLQKWSESVYLLDKNIIEPSDPIQDRSVAQKSGGPKSGISAK